MSQTCDVAIAAILPRPQDKATGIIETTWNGITPRVDPHSYERFVRPEPKPDNPANFGA